MSNLCVQLLYNATVTPEKAAVGDRRTTEVLQRCEKRICKRAVFEIAVSKMESVYDLMGRSWQLSAICL